MRTKTNIIPLNASLSRTMIQRWLLICGIISSTVYLGGDILAVHLWPDYDFRNQAISELMAFEAPTRPLLVALFSVYNLLLVAFGCGVFLSARPNISLRIAGTAIVTYGLIGMAGLYFAPMHSQGMNAAGNTTDAMHLIVTSVSVVLIMSFIIFAALAHGKFFRLYSIVTILIIINFGAVAGTGETSLAANQPTSWIGLADRICVYTALLWIVVLALTRLQSRKQYVTPPSRRPEANNVLTANIN